MATNSSIAHSHFFDIFDIFDPLDFGVLVIAADNQIIHVNQHACKMIGCNDDDLIGRSFANEFRNSAVILQQQAGRSDADQNRKQVGELQKVGSKPIKVTFWLTRFSENRNTNQKTILCFQPIKRGSSVKKLPEKYSLEKIIASLIHEIRNPLSGIVGFSNLLEQDLLHLKHAHHMILKIKQAAVSLEKLIGSLTIVSRDHSNRELKPVISQNYFGQLLENFQKNNNQNKIKLEIEKKFPQNDIVVSINPFSFNVLWEIVFQQVTKILQGNCKIIFSIVPQKNNVCFKVNLQPEENIAFSLNNSLRFPEIKQLLIEKIIQEHQGKIHVPAAKNQDLCITVELPHFCK